MDFSPTALAKARALAKDRGVTLSIEQADLDTFLKEFGFTLSKELMQAKWVRRPHVPKEKGQDGKPALPLKKNPQA